MTFIERRRTITNGLKIQVTGSESKQILKNYDPLEENPQNKIKKVESIKLKKVRLSEPSELEQIEEAQVQEDSPGSVKQNPQKIKSFIKKKGLKFGKAPFLRKPQQKVRFSYSKTSHNLENKPLRIGDNISPISNLSCDDEFRFHKESELSISSEKRFELSGEKSIREKIKGQKLKKSMKRSNTTGKKRKVRISGEVGMREEKPVDGVVELGEAGKKRNLKTMELTKLLSMSSTGKVSCPPSLRKQSCSGADEESEEEKQFSDHLYLEGEPSEFVRDDFMKKGHNIDDSIRSGSVREVYF
jgi:hypothetical protein